MLTDDEILDIYSSAVDASMREASKRDGFASNMSRESILAGMRAIEREAAARAIAEAAEEVDALTSEYTATAERLSEGKEWADSNRYFGYASGSNRAAAIVRARAAEIRGEHGIDKE